MKSLHFENGEKSDGSKISASVQTMPEKSENSKKFDGKNSLQNFDAKEIFLHLKNRSVPFPKLREMFCSKDFWMFTRYRFQNVSVSIP